MFVFQNTGARPSSNSDHGGSDTLQPSPHQAPLNSCKQDDGKGEFNLAKFVYPYSFSFCSTTAAGAAVAAAARTVEGDLWQVTTTPARPGCRRWWRRMAAAPVPLRRLQEESVAIDRSFDRPLALHSFVAKSWVVNWPATRRFRGAPAVRAALCVGVTASGRRRVYRDG